MEHPIKQEKKPVETLTNRNPFKRKEKKTTGHTEEDDENDGEGIYKEEKQDEEPEKKAELKKTKGRRRKLSTAEEDENQSKLNQYFEKATEPVQPKADPPTKSWNAHQKLALQLEPPQIVNQSIHEFLVKPLSRETVLSITSGCSNNNNNLLMLPPNYLEEMLQLQEKKQQEQLLLLLERKKNDDVLLLLEGPPHNKQIMTRSGNSQQQQQQQQQLVKTTVAQEEKVVPIVGMDLLDMEVYSQVSSQLYKSQYSFLDKLEEQDRIEYLPERSLPVELFYTNSDIHQIETPMVLKLHWLDVPQSKDLYGKCEPVQELDKSYHTNYKKEENRDGLQVCQFLHVCPIGSEYTLGCSTNENNAIIFPYIKHAEEALQLALNQYKPLSDQSHPPFLMNSKKWYLKYSDRLFIDFNQYYFKKGFKDNLYQPFSFARNQLLQACHIFLSCDSQITAKKPIEDSERAKRALPNRITRRYRLGHDIEKEQEQKQEQEQEVNCIPLPFTLDELRKTKNLTDTFKRKQAKAENQLTKWEGLGGKKCSDWMLVQQTLEQSKSKTCSGFYNINKNWSPFGLTNYLIPEPPLHLLNNMDIINRFRLFVPTMDHIQNPVSFRLLLLNQTKINDIHSDLLEQLKAFNQAKTIRSLALDLQALYEPNCYPKLIGRLSTEPPPSSHKRRLDLWAKNGHIKYQIGKGVFYKADLRSEICCYQTFIHELDIQTWGWRTLEQIRSDILSDWTTLPSYQETMNTPLKIQSWA